MAEIWRAACGRCPRCQAATLFNGFAKVADACRSCGLDLSRLRPGDRLLAAVMIVGVAVMTAVAIWLDGVLRPPLWLLLPILAIAAALGTIGVLRLMAGVVLTLRYQRMEDGA